MRERLTTLRLIGRRSAVPDSQWHLFSFLEPLGIEGNPPVGGFPEVRIHTGYVFRWGQGWFEEVRDSVGWDIGRKDKPQIKERVDVLMRLFKSSRITEALAALADAPLAIEDG